MDKKDFAIDPKFPLGNVVVTGRVIAALKGEPILEWMLARHQFGDWGNVSDDEKLTNDAAVAGYALNSAYRTDDGMEFWVVTDADRKFTTVMLPKEY
jgi:hypothetical protein